MPEVRQVINTRKVKVVPVGHYILEEMFRTGYIPEYTVIKGVPKDGRIIGIRHDVFGAVAHFLFTSKEFEEVKDGDIPPVLEITLQRVAKT